MDELDREYAEDNTGLEPVLICDSCNELVRIVTLHELGNCDNCGNKRMRNVSILNDKHQAQLKEWGMDDFLKLFEAADGG